MGRRRRSLLPLIAAIAAVAAWTLVATRAGASPTTHTVASRLERHGAAARARLLPRFQRAGIAYPPRAVTLLGLKRERVLQVYAGPRADALVRVADHPILAASGGPGPKLREGDGQVPEGLYRIELLNPNSAYHLSLRVNYPNAFDRRRGVEDGRRRLGGDIMIHGNAVSIGCLAMGDEVAEDLFVLAADTGLPRISVILAPWDLRRHAPPSDASLPAWAPGLYASIADALRRLPAGR
jgi:murein L,D-transpeptidase YafK